MSMSTSPLGLPVLPYLFRRSVISIMCHHDEPSPLSYEMTPSSPGRIPCCQVSISSSFEICGQWMALLFPFFYINLPMSLCLWLLHCCFVFEFFGDSIWWTVLFRPIWKVCVSVHMFRWASSNRTVGGDGNVLYLDRPKWRPLATCGYWTLDMFLDWMRTDIFILFYYS